MTTPTKLDDLETIDILELRRPRLRFSIIGPETEAVLARVKETGQSLVVTVEGKRIAVIDSDTTQMQLVQIILGFHPEMQASMEAAETALREGRTLAGADFLEQVTEEGQRTFECDHTTYTVEGAAQIIRRLEILHDIYVENMAEAFTTDGVLDENNSVYIYWSRLYAAFRQATGR